MLKTLLVNMTPKMYYKTPRDFRLLVISRLCRCSDALMSSEKAWCGAVEINGSSIANSKEEYWARHKPEACT